MDAPGAPADDPAAEAARLAARVRAAPSDLPARLALAEALILAGEFDRAEGQLLTLSKLDATAPVRIARLRHLLRAEAARHAWYMDGAAPSLVAAPAAAQQAALAVMVALRAAGAAAGAAAGNAGALAAAAEEARAPLPGRLDGTAFDDFRDLDDLCANYLEVLTADGGYLWVDWANVSGLRFVPPARPLDLLWREARLVLRDGRAADVVVPAIYVAPGSTGAQRMGRSTEWRDEGGLVRGAGQRCFLVGDDDRGILSMTELHFDPPVSDPSRA